MILAAPSAPPSAPAQKFTRPRCRQRRGHSTRLAASERAVVASCRTGAGPYHRLVGTPRRNPCELLLALFVQRSWRGGTAGTTAAPRRRHGCRCTTAAVVAGTRRPESAPTAPLARAGRQARGLPAGGTETARALGHCAPRRCASCYRARSLTTNPRCARPDERSPCHLRACRRARQHATPPRRPAPTHPARPRPAACLPPRARARWQAYVDAFLSNWMAWTLPGTHAVLNNDHARAEPLLPPRRHGMSNMYKPKSTAAMHAASVARAAVTQASRKLTEASRSSSGTA